MNKYTEKTNDTRTSTVKPNTITDWFIRLIKGIIIGVGFILPGLSGGVLAVILGIYDKLIRFLSDIRKNFLQNVAYFLPVAIGMAIGIVIFLSGERTDISIEMTSSSLAVTGGKR